MELRIQADTHGIPQRWKNAHRIVQQEMQRTMKATVLLVERQGKANTPVRTGTLRRSITNEVRPAGGVVIGLVGTNVPYARIIHDGGKTKAHVILPKNKKALSWPGLINAKGKRYAVRRVNHPGSTFKANPFLKRALAEKRAEVLTLWKRFPQRVATRLRGGS